MNILDFSNKNLLVLGDIHGDFKKLCFQLKNTINNSNVKINKGTIISPKNTVFTICGDCGIGFNSIEYYQTTLKKLNNILGNINSVLVLVRGNHDNPDYFNTNNFDLGFKNIILASDYSVLKTCKNTTLCIGGAVSHDREWRIAEEARRMRFSSNPKHKIYWSNEIIQPNENIISELKSEGITIDSIITHTAPIYEFFPQDFPKGENDAWVISNDSLVADIKKENELLKDIYTQLKNNEHEIKWWCCGHYHFGYVNIIPDTSTKMIVLNINKGKHIVLNQWDISANDGYANMVLQDGFVSYKKESSYGVNTFNIDWENFSRTPF